MSKFGNPHVTVSDLWVEGHSLEGGMRVVYSDKRGLGVE